MKATIFLPTSTRPLVYLLLFMAYFTPRLAAQNKETVYLVNALIREDSLTFTSLAVYPANTRISLLEACTQPELLVKLTTLQKKTSAEFKALTGSLTRVEQEYAWSLCRYPELINTLAEGGPKTKNELKDIAKNYPDDLNPAILNFGSNHKPLLVKINQLQNQNRQAFENILSGSNETVKKAFHQLLLYPEAIDLLTANMRTTALTGDLYLKDPILIQEKLDSAATAYAGQHAKELESWKTDLEKDPEAKAEMDESAEEFAGYHCMESETESDDVFERRQVVVTTEIVYVPYPYWFGYPWWYDYPCWYQYPWWYHCGYYWGPYGIVFIGLPSPYYTHWYFHHHPHHYYYNHFSHHYIRHYYGHRGTPSPSRREVTNWIEMNRSRVPQDFFHNDAGRPERIKELGKLDMDYESEMKKNPGSKMSRDEFLKTHSYNYPNMRKVTPEKPHPEKTDVPRKTYEPPVYKKPENPKTPPVKPRPNVTPKPKPQQPRNTGTPKPKPTVTPQPRPQQPKSKPVQPRGK